MRPAVGLQVQSGAGGVKERGGWKGGLACVKERRPCWRGGVKEKGDLACGRNVALVSCVLRIVLYGRRGDARAGAPRWRCVCLRRGSVRNGKMTWICTL